jgi:hypothetical protein
MQMLTPQQYYQSERLCMIATRSYTWKAIMLWFLYPLFFFPGLALNVLFLYQAYQTHRVLGHNPEGFLLWAFLIFFMIVLVCSVLAIVLFISGQ